MKRKAMPVSVIAAKHAIYTTLICLCCLLGININVYANTSSPDYDYYIRETDNREEGFVVILPIEAVLEEYATIARDDTSGEIKIVCGTLDVYMRVGSSAFVINGDRGELDVAVEIIDGLTYVPSTFFERTFGFWLDESGEGVVDLFMPGFIIDNI